MRLLFEGGFHSRAAFLGDSTVCPIIFLSFTQLRYFERPVVGCQRNFRYVIIWKCHGTVRWSHLRVKGRSIAQGVHTDQNIKGDVVSKCNILRISGEDSSSRLGATPGS